MKILVTGGAGFIGSNIALRLQEDHEVSILDNFNVGTKQNIEKFEGSVIKADITNFDWNSVKDVDVIFHQAAITDTIKEDTVMEINFTSFKKILEFASLNNIDIIYASSASVYGNGQIPMKESQELQPGSIYSKSKSMMDKSAEGFIKNSSIKIIGLRYFNVFGPGETNKGKFASMIYQLYNQMLSGNPKVFKYGEQERDFVYVKDVVKANLMSMKTKKSGIFNVGTGKSTSFNKLIQILNGSLGRSLKPEYFDNPYKFYQNNTLANLDKIKSELGYNPDYTTEEGIKDYVNILQSPEF